MTPNANVPFLAIADDGRSYSIEKELGSGIDGTVFKVENENKLYALKVYTSSPRSAFREVEVLKSVQGIEHIVPCYGSFCVTLVDCEFHPLKVSHLGVLMRLLPKPDCFDAFLKDLDGKPTDLTLKEINNIGRQVLETFKKFHAAGFLHGDIKSENLFYDPSTEELTIVDLGCTKHESLLDPFDPRGTRVYNAPD